MTDDKFRSKIEALTAGQNAVAALKWFKEDGDKLTAITVAAAVHYGSVTNEGKAAQPYINRAAQAMHRQIIDLAQQMAEDDLKRGEAAL
jgi:hypothetical protein